MPLIRVPVSCERSLGIIEEDWPVVARAQRNVGQVAVRPDGTVAQFRIGAVVRVYRPRNPILAVWWWLDRVVARKAAGRVYVQGRAELDAGWSRSPEHCIYRERRHGMRAYHSLRASWDEVMDMVGTLPPGGWDICSADDDEWKALYDEIDSQLPVRMR